MEWVKKHIAEAEMRGKVLVFVATRQAAEDLTTALRQVTTAPVDCLHGDKQQFDRSTVMMQFKKGALRIVIATDVAARGLDVADVATGSDGRRLSHQL